MLEGVPNQPKITIVATSDSADIAKIVVADNGCGLVEEFRDRIFEPFFSTRTAGKNVGLGLSVAQAVMSELGGRLTLDSDNGWTVATMVVPLRPLTDAPVKKTT